MEGIGVDLIAVERFRGLGEDDPFLVRTFTQTERAYCFSYADPAPHLAGHFAAKEAAWKALGTDAYPFTALEVRHDERGAPYMVKDGARLPLQISISHTDTLATAVAGR